MINEDLQVKLIDFAFSKCHLPDEKIKAFCGTWNYMSPEIRDKIEFYPKKADVWAVGVVSFRLLLGYLPFKTHDNLSSHENFSALPLETQDFLGKALDRNQCKRASARELLGHQWLQSRE